MKVIIAARHPAMAAGLSDHVWSCERNRRFSVVVQCFRERFQKTRDRVRRPGGRMGRTIATVISARARKPSHCVADWHVSRLDLHPSFGRQNLEADFRFKLRHYRRSFDYAPCGRFAQDDTVWGEWTLWLSVR